jgi:hypothetical protein
MVYTTRGTLPNVEMREWTWKSAVRQERLRMRHNAARYFTLIAAMFALLFLASSTFAADDDDPPSRAARLSYVSGSVSFEPGGTDEWVDAVVNRPLTIGDKLWADRDGRVELRIDACALRLGPLTGFSFLNLDDNVVQVRLTEGSLNVRVRRLDDNQTLEIDTPNLAFNVLRPGSYRIDVNENGDATLVTVRDGQGEVTGGGSAYPIHAGESANFSGTDQLSADVEGIGDDDDFDRWSRSRDARWEHSASARYVSDDAVGYEDLDEYGRWNSVPEYGTVWFPRAVAADWAPYRYGHWVWVSPWGWTWIDDAPWGFAPFHYGRWVAVSGRWGWVPCPPRSTVYVREYVRPVYAPALVAWVGGSHFGVSVAVGGGPLGVAWFPLGPRDVYAPSYHVSRGYVERVNVSNTVIVNRTQVTNVYNTVYVNKTVNVNNITYQNQRANNAVTATTQTSFTGGQPVGRNMVRVDARQVASAPVAPVTAIAPQQRSFVGATAAAKVRPPATLVNRNVVARTAPPPAPVPVSQQLQAVQANGGRPVPVTQVRANQQEPTRANVRVVAAGKTAALPPKGPSVNRPGQLGRPAQANQSTAQANQPNQPAVVQPNANQPNANQPNANRPVNPNQPNANRPANVNPNQPNQPAVVQPNANQPNVNQPNANRPANVNPNQPNPNRGIENRPGNVNPNQPNPNQPNANRPPNTTPPNVNQPNANRPANVNPNAPGAENPNRVNPNQPNPNQPNVNRPNVNPNAPGAENPNRPNPNRPPNANPNDVNRGNVNPNANPNNPNANRPPETRTLPENRAPNDRPPAAQPPAARPEPQPRQQQDQNRVQQQQQERQIMEQQRAQQQRQIEQQRADEQKRQQQVQRPPQQERPPQQQQRQQEPPQQQQRPAQQEWPQQQARPQQQERPQPKPQENPKPPKKDNKDKDKPPSR